MRSPRELQTTYQRNFTIAFIAVCSIVLAIAVISHISFKEEMTIIDPDDVVDERVFAKHEIKTESPGNRLYIPGGGRAKIPEGVKLGWNNIIPIPSTSLSKESPEYFKHAFILDYENIYEYADLPDGEGQDLFCILGNMGGDAYPVSAASFTSDRPLPPIPQTTMENNIDMDTIDPDKPALIAFPERISYLPRLFWDERAVVVLELVINSTGKISEIVTLHEEPEGRGFANAIRSELRLNTYVQPARIGGKFICDTVLFSWQIDRKSVV